MQHQVNDGDGGTRGQNEPANGGDQVGQVPAQPCFIGVHPPGHAQQTGQVHDQEGGVETYKGQPEAPARKCLRRHAPGQVRQPVVDAGHQGEEHAAHQHIVHVRHHKVGVVHLPVKGYQRQHHAGQTARHKNNQEADDIQHWNVKYRPAQPEGGQPGEYLNGGGNGHQHARHREKRLGQVRDTHSEHVVHPQAKADKAHEDDGQHNGAVTDNGALGKHG